MNASKREQIIYSMCLTYRHDYGITKEEKEYEDERDILGMLSSGVTRSERQAIWNQMAQLFDNCIAPHIKE
jgi:hypothetical protein